MQPVALFLSVFLLGTEPAPAAASGDSYYHFLAAKRALAWSDYSKAIRSLTVAPLDLLTQEEHPDSGREKLVRLNAKGVELLKTMEELHMILDMTHLNDEAFWHALTLYSGPIWASHNNCRKFVDHNRQFSDDMILELVQRKAVIGIALDAWMMVPDWIRGKSDPVTRNVTLDIMVDNIDHVCQLAGDSKHVGIGSDLDGGYGTEQCPHDLDTIADLQKLPGLLKARAYQEEDVLNILHGNFIRYLRNYFK